MNSCICMNDFYEQIISTCNDQLLNDYVHPVNSFNSFALQKKKIFIFYILMIVIFHLLYFYVV